MTEFISESKYTSEMMLFVRLLKQWVHSWVSEIILPVVKPAEIVMLWPHDPIELGVIALSSAKLISAELSSAQFSRVQKLILFCSERVFIIH